MLIIALRLCQFSQKLVIHHFLKMIISFIIYVLFTAVYARSTGKICNTALFNVHYKEYIDKT